MKMVNRRRMKIKYEEGELVVIKKVWGRDWYSNSLLTFSYNNLFNQIIIHRHSTVILL